MAPNCAELITATLAAQLAGIAAPLNGALVRGSTSPSCCGRSGARVLVTAGPELAPATWDTARALAARRHARRRPGAAAHRGGGPSPGRAAVPSHGVTRRLPRRARPARQTRPASSATAPRSADLAALFHTGGTTGAPKLAAHTHANEVADAWMLAANSLFDAATRWSSPRCRCSTSTPSSSPCSRRCSRGSRWCGPGRSATATPALFARFWKIVRALPDRRDERGAHRVRRAGPASRSTPTSAACGCPIVGASPLPAAVRDGFQAHTGVTLIEGYGLTEATCASARSFPDAPRPGLGRPAPALPAGEGRPHRRRRHLGRPARRPRPGVLAISGPDRLPRLRHRPRRERPRPGRPRQAGRRLAGHRRPRPRRRRRLRPPHRPGQGPHHPRRPQHRPRRSSRTRCSPTRTSPRPRRSAAPTPHAGEVPVAYVTLAPGASVTRGRAARLGERAGAPTAPPRPRPSPSSTRLPVTAVGKPYKLAAARGRRPPRSSGPRSTRSPRVHDGRRRRSRAAPSWPPSRFIRLPRRRPSRRSWAGTPSPGDWWLYVMTLACAILAVLLVAGLPRPRLRQDPGLAADARAAAHAGFSIAAYRAHRRARSRRRGRTCCSAWSSR